MREGRGVIDRRAGDPLGWVRRWACVGLVAMVTGLAPWAAHADDGWAEGRQFGLHEANAGSDASVAIERSLVASLTPGSVLIAQGGRAGADASAGGWQFRLAPYAWTARIKMNLAVDPVSRSTTIDFVDIVPQLHMALAGHFEATWREWTGFLEYMSVEKSETQNGVSVSTGLQRGLGGRTASAPCPWAGPADSRSSPWPAAA